MTAPLQAFRWLCAVWWMAIELQPLVDEMAEIERVIKKENVTGGNAVRLRMKIETVGRAVKRDFSYRKVGECIADDFRQ